MIILGVDPGLARMGYGVITHDGRASMHIESGVIETSKETLFLNRLKFLSIELKRLIAFYKPQAVAVEELYIYKNVKTALSVGHARGVILLSIADEGLPLFEFTPLQVKQALTGYGRASKEQVQDMVKKILKLKEAPASDDASDALAIAICHAQTNPALK